MELNNLNHFKVNFKSKYSKYLSKYTAILGFLILTAGFLAVYLPGYAQGKKDQNNQGATNTECQMCHQDADLKNERGRSVYVNEGVLKSSIHRNTKCTSCHADLKNADFPHPQAKKAKCSECHGEVMKAFSAGAHAKGLNKNRPDCSFCHGSHNIKKDGVNSNNLCSRCHQDGVKSREITKVLGADTDKFNDNIHDRLTGNKPNCSSCHNPHSVDPNNTPDKVLKACSKCHSDYKSIHHKFFSSDAWDKKQVPSCNTCHQPHNLNVSAAAGNTQCLTCHGEKNRKSSDGRSIYVNPQELNHSTHATVSCVQCHKDVNMQSHPQQDKGKVAKPNCGECHSQAMAKYQQSAHGTLTKKGNGKTPDCTTCHGSHNIKFKTDPQSRTYKLNQPQLCGSCHNEEYRVKLGYEVGDAFAVRRYYMESIHGRSLIKSNLLVSAACEDCHIPHSELPAKDPKSSVHHDNLPKTCAKCHSGVFDLYQMGVHSPLNAKKGAKTPNCSDCHSAHTIMKTSGQEFRYSIMNTCGNCHKKISETYFQSYHGKASRLGSEPAAKCSDCHGAHDIRPPHEAASLVSDQNKIKTCAKCHPGANKNFADYIAHIDYGDLKDENKYLWIDLAFWGFTGLIVMTFVFSWAHTLFFFFKSLKEKNKHRGHPTHHANGPMVKRFTPLHRTLHTLIILSFMTLAITGMAIRYSYSDLSIMVINFLGGVEAAGFLHRFAAVIQFGIFFAHVIELSVRKKSEFGSWKNIVFGPDTMLLNKKDWTDLKASFRWFFGKGPRPNYGRWIYWEKFDYIAEIWGVFFIGSTGLILWFPVFFTKILPGEALNLVTVFHSFEALLATGFIFTIHFFNTHFRPEKFPVDTVIFTGVYPLEELKEERPDEFRRLEESGKLDALLTEPATPAFIRLAKIFGLTALTVGILVIIWISIATLQDVF